MLPWLLLFFWFPLLVQAQQEVVLKGILLTNTLEESAAEPGIQIHDVEYPGTFHELEKTLLPYLEKPFNLARLEEIKKSILVYFRSRDRPIVDIRVPPQDITDGFLQAVITVGKVGKISCEGNEIFKDEALLSYLPIRSGDSLDPHAYLSGLSAMNKNPFRRTEMILTPGKEAGTTDVHLVTRERFPFRIYTGGDNTGNRGTGIGRVYSGFNWGNAFFKDHLLHYRFTTTPNSELFASHVANYTFPLVPPRHFISVVGSYARVRPAYEAISDKMKDHFEQSGRSAQLGIQHSIPWKKGELSLKLDWKRTKNIQKFIGDPKKNIASEFAYHFVDVAQVVTRFFYSGKKWKNRFSLDAELTFSPGKMLPHQTVEAYHHMRPGAAPTYVYIRGTGENDIDLPKNFLLHLSFTGQVAMGLLPITEQLSMGGFNTVRGYHQNEYASDHGMILNTELQLPPIHFKYKKAPSTLVFLTFCDFAYGLLENRHGPRDSRTLTGLGGGVRYYMLPYITARVDYGHSLLQLLKDGLSSGYGAVGFSPGLWHIGITATY